MKWVGWKIIKEGDYRVNLPRISKDEEAVVEEVCNEFSDVAKDEDISDDKKAREFIADLLKQHLKRNRIKADQEQIDYLTEYIFLATYGFGPLTYLLDDDDLEELAVIGLNNPVYVFHREKGWMSTNVVFTDRDLLVEIVNKMARKVGRRITMQNPRLNAVLPDGSRLHATMEPVSSLEITIRKFRKKPITIRDLMKSGYTYELLGYLWLIFQNDKNVVLCGNTAAGKTTALNALFTFVPFNERVILLEETPEIVIPHKHQIKMKTSRELGITMKNLIEDSLRMRPDRVIIGEVRTKDEILAMIESMNAGQARGCYATMHAQSAKELVSRLRYNDVLPTDIGAVNLVIVQRRFLRFDKGQLREIRRIIEACEVISQKDNVLLKHIFKYDPKEDKVVRTSAKSELLSDIGFANGMSLEDMEKEMLKRAKYLKDNLPKVDADKVPELIENYFKSNGAVG